MNIKVNFRIVLVALLSLCLLIGIGVGHAQESASSVFRIGVLDGERGPIARGAQLAVREINNRGGVTGADGTIFRLELIVEGTTESDNFSDAINALDSARVITVLGPQTTDAVLGHLPNLQSLGVPILTPALGDTVIASDTTLQLSRTRAAERLLGNALANYIVSDLGATYVATVQLDRPSTASRVGFSFSLGQIPQAPREDTYFLDTDTDITEMVSDVIASNPPVIVLYGDSATAAIFYSTLRSAGWVGKLAYPNALDPAFSQTLSLNDLSGILSVDTWTPAAVDATSSNFVLEFIRTFGYAPNAIEAASYDAVNLIAKAIGQPGALLENLNNLRDQPGVQGILNPQRLVGSRGEISDNVVVLELNPFGGARVVARYAGSERLQEDQAEVVTEQGTPTPQPTATPDGVVITIKSSVQNVRTGPGLGYDVLGQVRQGEQYQVIGATVDFSWVVIAYRGQNGWMATYLLDVFGNRADVPVVAIPPTPTPGPATNTPQPPAIPDLIVTSAVPSTIYRGMPTEVVVTIRNQGGANAGSFALAATFPPSDTYSAQNLNGLAAGTQTNVILPVTLTGATGRYTVGLVVDLNKQVDEGPVGESNNIFDLVFKLDQTLFLLNSTTLGSGSTIDLDPDATPSMDLQYNGTGLQTVGVCDGTHNCIGLISPNMTWDSAHYDAISAANGVNAGFISNAALTPGATLGVLTEDGRRGVIRIDAIQPGVSITFTYRVYQTP